MSGPVLTGALTALRANFDTSFPDRATASDGWIGDTAHQEEVSGHNPDDTPGVFAEYSDLDTKPEVRAIDVDADLNCPGVTMRDVIDKILATPNDTMRLRYIIHDRTEWAKSNKWKPIPYTGKNPHDKHAHFSGDPLFDENDSDWSVLEMGDNVSKEEVLDALDDTAPWASAGVGKFAEAHGINPTSLRALVEYVWANTQYNVPQLVEDVAAIKSTLALIVAKLDGGTAADLKPIEDKLDALVEADKAAAAAVTTALS